MQSRHSRSEQEIRLAVTALLIEVTKSDFKQSAQEQDILQGTIQNHFSLSQDAAKALIESADVVYEESTDYFQFTRLINQVYSPQQKVKLLEDLWKIAYADNELHRYEEHVIRRLAALLYVSHSDFIATKQRVRAAG